MRSFTLLLPSLMVLAGCAGGPTAGTAQQGRECFWASEVTGFAAAGADRARVNIGARESWELTLAPGCPDIDWAMRIGIRARGGERICPGRPAELLVPGIGGSDIRRCLVSDVRRVRDASTATPRD